MHVQDITWKPDMTVHELVERFQSLGFQSTEIAKASAIISKMKQEQAKIFLSFTSNMVTSGLRGFFAQLVELGVADVISTTVGGIEEDIMKALGETFTVGTYASNDIGLYEQGMNRVGNLLISNHSYEVFEAFMEPVLTKVYEKSNRVTITELLAAIGEALDDKGSFLYQAAKHNVPVFCPAITDGAMGYHLYRFQHKHPDFVVDIVKDFSTLISSASFDEKKGLIALGGGLSKHHAILGMLVNGGCDYAVYLTTARAFSGSMGGATTSEAISWGKVRDVADAVSVIGEVSVTFPLVMMSALQELYNHGIIKN